MPTADNAEAGPSTTPADEQTWEEDMEGLLTVPPGEEGMFMSHAGGEDDIFQEIISYAIPKK
jgi:hypothetical protein